MDELTDQLASVAAFSKQYREDFLDQPAVNLSAEEDPFRLRLFLKKIFASARSETTSAQYRKGAESVLRDQEQAIRSRWNKSSERITDDELDRRLVDEGVSNKHDRQMVVEVVDFLGTLDDYNHDVIDYTTDAIQEKKIDSVFKQLTDIHNIGPKKATLYLRDVVAHCDLENSLAGEQYRYVFPVDTWVFRVADKMEIVSTDAPSWATNSQEIVEACGDDVSPIAFNQGAWCIGANAFDILIEHLDQINPDEQAVS